jgi:hypothetical protein
MASELAAALAKVQAELPHIAKAQEGKVEGTTKQGKYYSYTYGYADLADVSDAIMPLLGSNGLAFTAWPCTDEQGRLVLDYALTHSSGEERTRQFPLWLMLPDRVTAQQIGGFITYARRYCLCAVTGVAPGGEDDDGAGGKEVTMDRPRRGPERYNGGDQPHDNTGRVRVPVPGPEHERLRQDPPADTGWDGEDHWVDQPAGPADIPAPPKAPRGGSKMTPAQAIVVHLKRLGVTDDAERLVKTTVLAGRTELLEHTGDLDEAIQRKISTELGKCRDRAALGALLDTRRAEMAS